jgi:diguanylate cyclase (GGDEF)-like protein
MTQRDTGPRATLRALGKLVELELAGFNHLMNDELTGLSSRRGFLEVGQYAVAHATKPGRSSHLLYIQVGIGSRDGRPGGSKPGRVALQQVLADVGRLLLDNFRKCDVVGRVGSQEFAVLLSDASQDTTAALERLNKAVRHSNLERAKNLCVHLETSTTAFESDRHSSVESLLMVRPVAPEPVVESFALEFVGGI